MNSMKRKTRAARSKAQPSQPQSHSPSSQKPRPGPGGGQAAHPAPTAKLRFAALIRVSTPRQKKEGHSLDTQKAQLEKQVKELGGRIDEVSWYGGQMHGTPGWEKQELDRLLEDATKKRFNAVIVTDADRWSRDNEASEKGIEVFKKHGIKFFAGATEWDLFNLLHELFLGMNAQFNKFVSRLHTKKSMDNRIQRADEHRIPTGGKLPYGRNWIWQDPETRKEGHWEIDPVKQGKIVDCAKRYIAGESLRQLAKEHGLKHILLHRVLTKQAGKEWSLKLYDTSLNIQREFKFKIPHLLEDSVIKDIHDRIKKNRHGRHGKIVNDFLFRGMISCAQCGYALEGQAYRKTLCYRHTGKEHGKRECPNHAKRKAYVREAELEDTVMRHLFETFGNPVAVQRAMETLMPKNSKIQEAVKEKEFIEKELAKVEAARLRTIDLVDDEGTTNDEDIKPKLKTEGRCPALSVKTG